MTEYERLREAFILACGVPVRENEGQIDSDERDPSKICWVAKNVWLCPNNPEEPDVQLNAWHGEAWVSETTRLAGLWCGLNIENKPAFRAALRFSNAESVGRIAQRLDGYRVSFGSKRWPSNLFTAIDVGWRAVEVDRYRAVFTAIPGFYGDRILRPQIQIYRQIGDWLDPSNTVERLTQEIAVVRGELSELFRLVTGGFYPPQDVD